MLGICKWRAQTWATLSCTLTLRTVMPASGRYVLIPFHSCFCFAWKEVLVYFLFLLRMKRNPDSVSCMRWKKDWSDRRHCSSKLGLPHLMAGILATQPDASCAYQSRLSDGGFSVRWSEDHTPSFDPLGICSIQSLHLVAMKRWRAHWLSKLP